MMRFQTALKGCTFALAALTGCSSGVGGLMPNGSSIGNAADALGGTDAYRTTVAYVETFYPLWFTYEQWQISSVNKLIGPARMTPIYHAVVAPNDDTLYGNTVLNLTPEPVILTIPKTKGSYSVLSTDAFGDVNDTGINGPGVYGFTGPNSGGSLPAGITPVPLSIDYSGLIIRVDKYSGSGQNEKAEAERFRRQLRVAPLSLYEKNPNAQPTRIVPVLFFAEPFKTIADTMTTKDPIQFLTQLQSAVGSSFPPALTAKQRALAKHFNALFDARNGDAPFSQGTRRAHQAILDTYLNHTDATNWISFDSIGTTWSDLVRSAISEFIQYGNSHATAAYYQTFKDAAGAALDGGKHAYVVTFPRRNIPQAERFWSITAYTPDSITLIRNAKDKYLVGSYTPGLHKNRDGSISIYVSQRQPKGVPEANWLPVDGQPFNLMLRVYGPEGKVKAGTYVPPAVRVR